MYVYFNYQVCNYILSMDLSSIVNFGAFPGLTWVM